MPALPAIAMDGAKGVCESHTAARRVKAVRGMGDAAQRPAAGADFGTSMAPAGTRFIDEWPSPVPMVSDGSR